MKGHILVTLDSSLPVNQQIAVTVSEGIDAAWATWALDKAAFALQNTQPLPQDGSVVMATELPNLRVNGRQQ